MVKLDNNPTEVPVVQSDRTQACGACDRGSNPLGDTNIIKLWIKERCLPNYIRALTFVIYAYL